MLYTWHPGISALVVDELCLVTLGASFGGAKFEVQNAKFEVQNAKFEVQNTKFEVQNVVPVFEFQRSSREIF